MTSHRCFVCNDYFLEAIPPFQTQTTRSTQSNIVYLLEQFLGFSLRLEPGTSAACASCFNRFNEYDEAIQIAKRAQDKLIQLYTNSKYSDGLRVCNKKPIKQELDAPEECTHFNNVTDDREDTSSEDDKKQDIYEPEGTNKIVCHCKMEFTSNDCFLQHLCNSRDSTWICDICSNIYKTKHALRLHMHVHSAASRFTCPICGKQFTQRIALHRHQPLHTGEKPFQVNTSR